MSARVKLKSLYVSGFKSFAWSPLREVEKDGKKEFDYQGKRVEFGDVTVFLGANGAGKSNVVSLFEMLWFMSQRRLREFVNVCGGGESLLHYGSKTTARIDIRLDFEKGTKLSHYECSLASAAPDSLVVTSETADASLEEKITVHRTPSPDSNWGSPDVKVTVTSLPGAEPDVLLEHMLGMRTFQFDDTSPSARIRKGAYVEDGHALRTDGGNLAAFLMAIRANHPAHYERIRRTIQTACPQFDDFELAESPGDGRTVLLNWRSRDHHDYLMGPHQISDGTLRFMALTTLLLQPSSMLPATVVIDEPELGLHPTAIAMLAAMVHQASEHCQVVLATQSPTLVDHFELSQIRAMAHTGGASTFLQLDEASLKPWLEDYSLGEMWQKNLFRGGPEHG